MLFQLDIMYPESFSEILLSLFILEELNSTSVFKSYWPVKSCRDDTHRMTEARQVGRLYTEMALHGFAPHKHMDHIFSISIWYGIIWCWTAFVPNCPGDNVVFNAGLGCLHCSFITPWSVNRNFAMTQRDSRKITEICCLFIHIKLWMWWKLQQNQGNQGLIAVTKQYSSDQEVGIWSYDRLEGCLRKLTEDLKR